MGGPARPGLPPWEAEDLGDYDLLNPSSAARRKQVLLEEGWPRGELPSKVGLREHMQARAALRYKVGLTYHGNAAETGEYLYDPSYAPTLDIGQVVHTLNRMFNLNVPPLCARAFYLGPRVVSPHPQGLQGSHLNLLDQRKKETKQTTKGGMGRVSGRRHHTGILRRGVWC